MDRSFRFIAVNQAWLAMTGLDEAQAIGRTARDLFRHHGLSHESALRDALAGREVRKTIESPVDGTIRHLTISPWRDQTGEIGGLIIENIANEGVRWRNQRRERRLSLAMEMAKVYAYEIDFRTGDIRYEPARPHNDVVGARFRTYEDVLAWQPEEHRQAHREMWEHHLATGELMVQEYCRNTPDGHGLWQMSVSEAVRDVDNHVVGLVGVTQVIDDRKRAELALVAEKEAAQAADRAKSEFLANVSHEIRTPLNGVLGLASLLAKTELDAAQGEMVRTIESSAQMLNALLSDVLDLAKIESGRLELDAHAFDPVEAIAHVHNLFTGAAAEKRLAFTCDIDPSLPGLVFGDRTRLSQILTNLCSNAIKFTSAGAVTLRGWAEDGPGLRRLSFSVTDTGVGIDQSTLDGLFERFVQADGSNRRSSGGAGLGLAISRSLARMMGGDVVATSGLGRGSTFTLTVEMAPWSDPVAEAAEHAAVDGALPQDQLARVLLVEDHPVNRRVVELILGGLVWLEWAENGADGLAAYKERAFDLVLMDMQMPVMDGLEATRAIRAFERQTGRTRTPVIMLSANAMSEHVNAGLDAGADSHLAKPITADQLVQAVARAIEGAGEAPMAAAG